MKADAAMLKSEAARLWNCRYRPRQIREYLNGNEIRKLHIGAGPHGLAGWLNTDVLPAPSTIAYLDIREALTFPDGTFDYIFSEHLIEHVQYGEGIFHLRECYRVLRRNGRIRIATPDIEFLIRLYTGRDYTVAQKDYVRWTVENVFGKNGFSHPTFVLNNFFRAWGHQFIYDEATLGHAMRRAGFADICRFPIGHSNDPHLQGLEQHGKSISEGFNELQTMVLEGRRDK